MDCHHDGLAQTVVQLLGGGVLQVDIVVQLQQGLGLLYDPVTIKFHRFSPVLNAVAAPDLRSGKTFLHGISLL